MAREGGTGRRVVGSGTAVLIALALFPAAGGAVAQEPAAGPASVPVAGNAGGQEAKPRVGVRPLEASAGSLVAEARLRSSTVERLLSELERSDLVVYLRLRLMPRCTTGRLTLLGAAGGLRYVKVEVAATNRTEEAIGWLGHELQHALEVAGDPDVHDEPSLERLYRRIGGPGADRISRYETDAAIKTRHRVIADIRSSECRTATGASAR